jgi:hypothetical protein
MRERREENLVETKSVEIPCFIGSYNALRSGDLLVLVKLFLPHHGIPVWAKKPDLKILKQGVDEIGREGFKATLRGRVISETVEILAVEIDDRSSTIIKVPKDWLARETEKRREASLQI